MFPTKPFTMHCYCIFVSQTADGDRYNQNMHSENQIGGAGITALASAFSSLGRLFTLDLNCASTC